MSFRVVLVYDSREKFFPGGVEESLKPHGYTWDGTGWVRSGYRVDRLDFPPGLHQPDLPPVGYRRVVKAAGLHWDQRWLWYLDNPGPPRLAGVGRHEGDWEFAQFGCIDPECTLPVLVTCSQHRQGGKREWWASEIGERDGEQFIRLYVALGSHAMYFAPGRQGGGLDECDGRGRHVTPEWRKFGDWAEWRGRWGNSDGRGRSPESPGCQGNRWTAPHLFHSSAR
jgi:hypothetical protein